MKKNYTTPTAEKLAFRYRDQIVAASAGEMYAGDASGDQTTGGTTDYGELRQWVYDIVSGIWKWIFG